MTESASLLDRIRRESAVLPTDDALRAAVLIPLIDKEDGIHILYEKRADDLDIQPGEVCFPGGHIEPMEEAGRAAVREACEELLIAPESIKGLTDLGVMPGPVGRIGIFTGIIEGYNNTFCKDEVGKVFSVPLTFLKENPPKEYEASLSQTLPDDFPFSDIPAYYAQKWNLSKRKIYFYYYEGQVIWGFTASVTLAFLEMIDRLKK